jgi:hypothetical protein
VLLAGAVAWGALLVVLAAVLPIETVLTTRAGVQPRETLLHGHGAAVLLLAAIPLVVALGTSALLRFGVGASTIGGLGMARLLTLALLVAAVGGTVTDLIGIFVIPMAVILVVVAFQCRSLGRRPISLRRRPQPVEVGR